MNSVSLEQLKELSNKVEELVNRYDVAKEVYEDLYQEQLTVHRYIEENPGAFKSKDNYAEAYCLNGYIILCLLARINECNDNFE